jgi:hypothetical protein
MNYTPLLHRGPNSILPPDRSSIAFIGVQCDYDRSVAHGLSSEESVSVQCHYDCSVAHGLSSGDSVLFSIHRQFVTH